MHAALTATDMQREAHTIKDQTFELVHCPPGTFTMGSPEDEPHRQDVEGQHEVTLTRAFALGVVPNGRGRSMERSARGGHWFGSPRFSRVAASMPKGPEDSTRLGLRLARTIA